MKLLIIVSAIALFSCNKGTETVTLNLQPNEDEGQDAIVSAESSDFGTHARSNHNFIPELSMMYWIGSGSDGLGSRRTRSYIKFTGLSKIPPGAKIISAKLSLFGLSAEEALKSLIFPLSNSIYPGSPHPLSNSSWIKAVTGGDWMESTISWDNMPSTSDKNQVEIPASTSRVDFNIIDLDITQLVKDIIESQHNYGFCLQLQTEQVNRSLLFAASEFEVASKRPKLVVQYRE